MDRIGIFVMVGLAAGVAGAADTQVSPGLAPRGTVSGVHVAHIYYNVATGEKVATLLDGATRPADTGSSSPVWISENRIPCASYGQTSGINGLLDDPGCSTCMDSTKTGVVYLDWGDIEFDSVIDCVSVSWVSEVNDDDLDGDGIADGVEGFAGTWAWFDYDDGFDACTTRLPVGGFTLLNLPGDTFAPGRFQSPVYIATVDLAGDFSTSMAFEIGDTDGQSIAPNFYPFGGADLDGDGYSDFSYSLVFTQPGTYDFDNADGDDDPTTGVDGDAWRQEFTGWPLAVGEGEISPDGSTYMPETSKPGAIGIEDAFDFFADVGSDGTLDHMGTFWYGGFHCDRDGDGAYGQAGLNNSPFTQFYIGLYGPGASAGECGDLAPPYGVLNFFDVAAFIAFYNAGDAQADLSAPFGTLDFFDVAAYMTLYNSGCP